MEKHFITYKQALALKQLGFDGLCLYSYYQDGIIASELKSINWNLSDTICSAPIKSQVFEWFREKYNLYHEIRTFVWDYDKKELGFSIRTYLNPISVETERLIHPEVYETYEEAESSCIDKLIQLIKQK